MDWLHPPAIEKLVVRVPAAGPLVNAPALREQELEMTYTHCPLPQREEKSYVLALAPRLVCSTTIELAGISTPGPTAIRLLQPEKAAGLPVVRPQGVGLAGQLPLLILMSLLFGPMMLLLASKSSSISEVLNPPPE